MAKLIAPDEIKKLSEPDLRKQVQELKQHLYELHCQARIEKLQDTSQLNAVRRTVARIKGELGKRTANK